MTLEEKYKTLLERYVLKEPKPEWAKKPLRINQSNLATNGVVTIITPIVIPFCNVAPPKIVYAIKQHKIKQGSIIIENLKMVLFHWPVTYLTKHTEYVCAACNGKGKVEFDFHFGVETYSKRDDCPVCGGDGIYAKPYTARCMEHTHLLKIGNSMFSFDVVKQITYIADMLKVETVECFQSGEEEPTLILFTPDVSGLFCPRAVSADYHNFTPFILTR